MLEYRVQTSPNYFVTQKQLFHINDKSGFIAVGNWTTLDNWGTTQSKNMVLQSVSAV